MSVLQTGAGCHRIVAPSDLMAFILEAAGDSNPILPQIGSKDMPLPKRNRNLKE